MNADLSGKKAVITGSTAGVGFDIARTLAQAGASVVINGRRPAAVEAAVAKLAAAAPGVSVQGVACDVGTAEGCARLLAEHPEADIFVNNIGIYESRDFLDVQDEEWTRYFEVNVMSAVRLSRAYLPGMLKKYFGRIIFISSEWALNIPADMIPYGLSKAAVFHLAQSLSKRTSCTGVTANAVLLGPIRLTSEESRGDGEVCLTMEETLSAFSSEHHALASGFPHVATSDEVASTVLYLASAQASATTGALLHLDGAVGATRLRTN